MLIIGEVKNYHWGSTTAIPELLGWQAGVEPIAELWFGAHPLGTARLGESAVGLDAHIKADPTAALGESVARDFGSLPFMLKLLAANEPLSLQTHPSTAQAQLGYDREETQGINRQAENRCFRDRSHKPELICALSEFSALCGIREPSQTLEFLATIPTAALDALRWHLAADPSPNGIAKILAWLLRQDSEATARVVQSLTEACEVESAQPFAAERAVAAELGRRYRSDPAVLAALLMNLVTLQPGEALFFGAGNLHAYLYGTGVELMANSDNVVRAGLTSKHVDIKTLLDIVDTKPLIVDVQRPSAISGVARYHSPVKDFSLTRFDVGTTVEVEAGPAILLCISGEAQFVGSATTLSLAPGSAVWMPACQGAAQLSGTATVFRAAVGLQDC